MRRYATLLYFNLLLLGVLLLLSEGIYRGLFPNRQICTRTYLGQNENREISWARADQDLGWIFSGVNMHTFSNPHYGEDQWSAIANLEGFRAKIDYRNVPPKKQNVRVMLLGNSFVFGTYINNNATLSSLLQEKLGSGYEVYNFGIPGWGLDQMYLAYEKYWDMVDPDYVVIVYIDPNIWRVFQAYRKGEGMNKPSFNLLNGRLRLRGDDETRWFNLNSGFSAIINHFFCWYRNYETINISEAIFLRLSKKTIRREQKLLIIRYPEKGEVVGKFDRNRYFSFEDLFRRNNIFYLDPLEAMRGHYILDIADRCYHV